MGELDLAQAVGQVLDEHTLAAKAEFKKSMGWTAATIGCVALGLVIGGEAGSAVSLLGGTGSYGMFRRHNQRRIHEMATTERAEEFVSEAQARVLTPN